MKRLIIFFLALSGLVGLGALPARADSPGSAELEGDRFAPSAVVRGGRTMWSLQDPEVKRLVARTAARVQWSSSGRTMYVFTPLRETSWTSGADTVLVDGHETPAPGRLEGTESDPWMEPDALFYCLGLAARKDGPRFRLNPQVGGLREGQEDGGAFLRVGVSVPVRWEQSRPEPGVLRLRFPDCRWAGPAVVEAVGDVNVKVQEGEDTVVELRYPPFWDGRPASGLSLTEVKVGTEPQHAFPPSARRLEKAEFQRTADGDAVVFTPDAAVPFCWSFDRSTRRLSVEFPGVTLGQDLAEVQSPESPLQSGRFRTLGTPDRPVLRFEGTLAAGSSFALFQTDTEPSSLVLRMGPEGTLEPMADSGTATTGKVSGGRGVVVLDPGHGGGDPGCVNRALGTREKDVTLDVALRLRDLLQAQGWTVLMTREDDRDVSWAGSPDKVELQARCDVANEAGADLFVSLHCNASANGTGAGTSIHWYKDQDLELARDLEFVLGERLGLGQVGLRRDRFYVLRHTNMPSVLIEMAYLTHPSEGAMLSRPEFRQQIAERLAGNLVAFMAGRFARGNMPSSQRMP